MRTLTALLVWTAMATSALAQHSHQGHAAPEEPVDPHAGHVGHSTAPATGEVQPAPMVHPGAGHMDAAPSGDAGPARSPDADGHGAHHGMEHQTEPEHHAEPANPHEGHPPASEGGEGATVPSGPAPAEASAGPAHAADTVFGALSMEASRRELHRMHGGGKAYKVMIDRLEGRVRLGQDLILWDAQAWYGGDIDKVWLKTEGEGEVSGGVESAEVQALWSRAVTPWFNLQAGVRHDFRPDPERTHLVLGLQGLAPYWLEVDAALFLSDKGDLTARLEVEYDLRITQRLILQPRGELELSAQEVPELELGSGLTKGELGVRLRYEIRPEFAPYVGIEYERAFGDTAELKRLGGEEAGDWFLTVGVRTWF